MVLKASKHILTVILAAGGFASAWAAGEPESISVGTAWVPEGGDDAPVRIEQVTNTVDGKAIAAARISLFHRDSWRKVFLSVTNVNLAEYNTLTCRVRLALPPGVKQTLHFHVLDSHSDWSETGFGRHAEALPDGDFLFKWDVIHEPDSVGGFQVDTFNRLGIGYAFESIPEGTSVVVTLSEVQFHKGQRAITGDPERFEQWQAYISRYTPDYSDSSACLQPPESGRLKAPLGLIVNGQPRGEIVLAATASEAETNAAGELRFWLRQITGAQLPVVAAPTAEKNVKLLLGAGFAAPRYAADLAALKGSDGYAVRVSRKTVHIFGAGPKGTLNGVFAFIENNSDIIWARPQKGFGTVFSKRPDFTIAWGDALDRPVGLYRGWQPDYGGDGGVWMWSNRNRNNYVSGDPVRSIQWGGRAEFGGGHNLHSALPEGDPRYYPVIDGKKPAELSIWKHQICMSVPDLERTYASNVIQYIRVKAPAGIDTININIEDNWGVCECEQCLAPIRLPDGRVLDNSNPAFRSTQFFIFLNRVTEGINRVYPDMKVQTYAYFFTAIPPELAVNPNIDVLFCPYVRKDHRTPLCSPINDTWWRRLTQWARVSPNVIIREYYGIENGGRPLAEVVAFDLKSYLSLGVRSIAPEIEEDGKMLKSDNHIYGVEEAFDLNMMEYWILNRLYWNPGASVEGLRKYFIRRTFRESAPEMERFFGAIREAWFKNAQPSDWANIPGLLRETVVLPGRETEMRTLLAQAAAKATHPVSRLLIARIQERFEQGLNPVKESDEVTPEVAWRYGWRSEAATHARMEPACLELNGQLVPALDLSFSHRDEAAWMQLMCNFAFDACDMTFEFTLVPTPETAGMAVPYPQLRIQAPEGPVETSPETAYTPLAAPPGAMRFSWHPTGLGGKLDLSKAHRLSICYPYAKIPPGKSAEFHLVDWKITRGGGATNAPAERKPL